MLISIIAYRRKSNSSTSVSFSLERIREMGELVALNAFVKEIVTQDINKDSFFTTTGKILLIYEFDVEFRFDLRQSKISNLDGIVKIHLPAPYAKVIPKKQVVYDERKASYLGILGVDISPELRNDLTETAKNKAVEQAGTLKEDLSGKLQASAISTLSAMAYGMGAKSVEVTFETGGNVVQLPVAQEQKKAA
ncbi:MAG: DUF4230 domain-containing protein [Proteobacteria bacterium]|nr:MAG: DUF4230 domain-containing protein [Pseudomonadota bacterium]